MRKLRNKVVAIVGQGYVGLPLAMAAVSAGWTVIGIDSNKDKVTKLNRGLSPVEDVSSDELSKSILANAYRATFEFATVSDAAVVILCVPTPLDENRNPDTCLLENAAAAVASYLSSDTLVVSESTSYPGTLSGLIIPTIENLLTTGVKWDQVCSCT
jgi:UDP-N-acetyl-D-glucosamine dehydrogenase